MPNWSAHISKTIHSVLRTLKTNKVFFWYFLSCLIYFLVFWSNAIYTDVDGNVQVTHVSLWGDWAAHFTMGSAMANRELILENSPFMIGAKFSYPFVANMISASLIRLGVPFFQAFVVPSFFASVFFVTMLFIFYKKVFIKPSIALIASLIFLFNGGTGFVQYIGDIQKSPTPIVTAINPPREYTSMDEHYIRWISVVNSQLIPQRAFTLGFPIALLGLLIIFQLQFPRSDATKATKTKQWVQKKWRLLICAIILLGLLPIIHTHSFLASGIILSFWVIAHLLLSNKKDIVSRAIQWSAIGLGTLIIALPLLKQFFFSNVTGDNFIKWFPGWYIQEFHINWLYFWFLNWGITPIVALVGGYLLIQKKKNNSERLSALFFFLPFFVIFALANLFLFQPFIWDNTKLILWSSVGISGLAGYALVHLWDRKESETANIFRFVRIVLTRSIVVLVFLFAICSGTIDAWRILRFDVHTFQMYSKEEIQLATWVKNNTSADSIWLTGDKHNLWLYNLTGRQPLLTFIGWLWTHGYDYTEVEAATRTMYRFPNVSRGLFEEYGVDYVLIGPEEIESWDANKKAFDELFPVVIRGGEYSVYQVDTQALP